MAPVVVRLRDRGVPVVLIPEGSANNVARTLGVSDTPLGPAEWADAAQRRLDVGRASAGGVECPFVESAGGGVVADVLRRAEAEPDDPGGAGSLRQGRDLLRRAIAEAAAPEWGVVVDGHDRSGRYLAVEAMNIRESGPRLPLAPGADPGDGLLDVVLAAPGDREVLARLADPPEHPGGSASGDPRPAGVAAGAARGAVPRGRRAVGPAPRPGRLGVGAAGGRRRERPGAGAAAGRGVGRSGARRRPHRAVDRRPAGGGGRRGGRPGPGTGLVREQSSGSTGSRRRRSPSARAWRSSPASSAAGSRTPTR